MPQLLWFMLLDAAGRIAAQNLPPEPKLTPLPHPNLPKPVEITQVAIPWLIILCGIAAVILFGIVIWLLFRRQGRKAPMEVPPLTFAHRRLMELLSEVENLEPAETGHRVSVIMRDYQLGRYRVPAPFRTREELYDLREFVVDAERQGRFASVALTCDQFAFAAVPATKADAESLVHAAIETLRREVFHAEGELPGLNSSAAVS